ncbi:MAG: PD-(D/E)XK nuclease family protein, partial [Gaiellales bacterium]
DAVVELEVQGRRGRDLVQVLRRAVELALPLVPRRLEVAFGSERAPPELQRGLALDDFAVSGKIDRIDLDPFSARGIVQDYKSGSAHSAARIDADGRLQIPLYALALRDLIGVEPVGALYRSLSGKREARGILRADEADLVPGLARRDYLDEDEFWEVVERAKGRAVDAVGRIRQGDVRHDPRAGECPAWCDRWPMCRVERA